MIGLLRCVVAGGLMLAGQASFAQDPQDATAGTAAAPVASSARTPGIAAQASPASADPAAGHQSARYPDGPQVLPVVRQVRALQQLQDRIAHGDVAAHRAHRDLLNRVHDALIAAPMDSWTNSRNVEAAIAYVLGGGPPDVLSRIKDIPAIDGVNRQLLLGTLAYATGDEGTAAGLLLKTIDARNLPPTVAGQIAMVQATLVLHSDPRLALGYLDLARALSAGTLVEEAALRRSLVMAGGLGDIDRFEQLTSQYIRRFRNSVYAGNFREKFTAALAALNFTSDDARLSQLVGILDQFDPASQLDLYLFVARRALVRGNMPAVKLASTKAMALSGLRPDAEARARFYMATSDITSERSDAADMAFATLLDLDPALYSNEDEALLETVLDTARQIRTLDVRATVPPPERRLKDDVVEFGDQADRPEETATLSEARALLTKSDGLLRRLGK